jgi:hypothetical protein
LQVNLVASVLLLCACGSVEKEAVRIPPVSESRGELEPQIAELNRLYKAARLEHERRAICLRAIDESVIQRGASVSAIDGIFGTDFASDLPSERGTNRGHWILFADQPSPLPKQDGIQPAVGDVGWYLDFEYDRDGKIQNYYFSNLHKGLSRRVDGNEPPSSADLRQQYQTAKSERECRDVALQAIDEGVIQTFGPVNISTVDAIFGTQLASHLPTKKEDKRTGIVDFASSPTTGTDTGKDGSRTSDGWFMAVEYYSNGNIANYYLSNVRK